jgi:hypothetical protein
MTPRTARELDHVAVRGFDDRSRQFHGVEAQVGQRLGNTLPVQLGDDGFNNLHEAGSRDGLVGHGCLPSFVRALRAYLSKRGARAGGCLAAVGRLDVGIDRPVRDIGDKTF